MNAIVISAFAEMYAIISSKIETFKARFSDDWDVMTAFNIVMTVLIAMCLSLYAYVVAMGGVPFVTAVCVLATAFFFRKAIANQFRQNRLFMGTMYGHYFNCAICVVGGMMCPWVGMSMILVLVTDMMTFL